MKKNLLIAAFLLQSTTTSNASENYRDLHQECLEKSTKDSASIYANFR
jgi:hypothetical protein